MWETIKREQGIEKNKCEKINSTGIKVCSN